MALLFEGEGVVGDRWCEGSNVGRQMTQSLNESKANLAMCFRTSRVSRKRGFRESAGAPSIAFVQCVTRGFASESWEICPSHWKTSHPSIILVASPLHCPDHGLAVAL